jgi:hypothetical protein
VAKREWFEDNSWKYDEERMRHARSWDIVDSRNVPINKIESIARKSRLLRRYIRENIGCKETLLRHLYPYQTEGRIT